MATPTDSRPDPDVLLAQMQQDALTVRRGKLRIYFGASAGVGKTYAMLSAAQRAQQAGQKVLVGVVETHGRQDTMALQADLALLPLRKVPHRGQVLLELDLDAALSAARHPGGGMNWRTAMPPARGTPSAGRMYKSCSMQVSMSGRQSMCSIWRV